MGETYKQVVNVSYFYMRNLNPAKKYTVFFKYILGFFCLYLDRLVRKRVGEKEREIGKDSERTSGQSQTHVARFMVQRFHPLSHGAPEAVF